MMSHKFRSAAGRPTAFVSNRLGRVRDGAVTVEFGVVLGALMLFILGGIELTRFSTLRHTASHAAYLAARESIYPGANVQTARRLAEEHLGHLGIKDAVIEFDPAVITERDSSVSVSVRIPFASNDWAVASFISSDAVGVATLLTERPAITMSRSLSRPTPVVVTQPPQNDFPLDRPPFDFPSFPSFPTGDPEPVDSPSDGPRPPTDQPTTPNRPPIDENPQPAPPVRPPLL